MREIVEYEDLETILKCNIIRNMSDMKYYFLCCKFWLFHLKLVPEFMYSRIYLLTGREYGSSVLFTHVGVAVYFLL